MTIIFRVKSDQAYIFKILAELIANNIKTGCFEIDEKGISLRMMDHHKKVLIDFQLNAENFNLYKFDSKKMFLGINLNHFYKMLRSTKKKDALELYIDDEHPNDLAIKVTPKDNNRITISTVKIQQIQNLDIELPVINSKPINIPSSEYQKMIKELGHIGNIIKVTSKTYSINFSTSASGVYGRDVKFGENSEEDSKEEIKYEQTFNTENLCRITKLSGLSNNIQVYPGSPFLFKSKIGNIGLISIYIKSIEELESELDTHNIDDSDSD
jgi:proliferating cell nuclear antigen PCNA